MEKIIKIGDKQLRLKASASFALCYKSYFQKDILKVILPLIQDLIPIVAKNGEITEEDYPQIISACKNLELVDLYQVVWVLAKTADKDIDVIDEWLDEFDEFPLFDIMPEVVKLIIPTLISKKKAKKKQSRTMMKL